MQTTLRISSFLVSASFLPTITLAAESEPAKNAAAGNNFNPVLISLVTLGIILLFAIAVLAGVLRSAAFAYRNKTRQQKSNSIIKTVVMLMSFSLPAFVSYAQALEVTEEKTAIMPSMIAGLPATQFYFLLGIVLYELAITLALVLLIRMMVRLLVANPEIAKSAEGKAALEQVKRISFWDRFNKSVDIEKEHDIMLDHNYDDIQELDNSLPPWWKYGFYFTILISFVYIWYYHAGGDGPSSHDEFVAEVQKGEEAKAAYLAKSSNNVDENTVKMGDAVSITSGSALYQTNCAACHARDGGGSVGPNLTDDYWLHGGSIKDVFKSVKYGWPDKGMKSWKDDFSPKQLAELSSYIKSLKGTKPAAPKGQQGELYAEAAESTAKETVATQ